MRFTWRIGRIFGIDIRIDSSWVVIFILFTWFLAGSYFPKSYPHWSSSLNWAMGFLTSLLLFASVLFHELAHSLVALKQGERVDSVTLFILGGVAAIHGEPEEPLKEFAMAVVGPIASFVLAAVFFILSFFLFTVSEPLSASASYLALLNIVLGVFNLLPGFPMDGGRVFRSILWKATGNLEKATRIASLTGQGFAFLLIFVGILRFLRFDIGGLWYVLIGWFLHSAAARGYEQVKIKTALEGLKARDLMNTDFETVPVQLPVQNLVDEYILGKRERVFLVTDNGELRGIVCLEDVKAMPRADWGHRTVGDIMTPRSELKSVSPETEGTRVLADLAANDIHQVPVMEGEKIAGIICRNDILRVLQLRSDLKIS